MTKIYPYEITGPSGKKYMLFGKIDSVDIKTATRPKRKHTPEELTEGGSTPEERREKKRRCRIASAEKSFSQDLQVSPEDTKSQAEAKAAVQQDDKAEDRVREAVEQAEIRIWDFLYDYCLDRAENYGKEKILFEEAIQKACFQFIRKFEPQNPTVIQHLYTKFTELEDACNRVRRAAEDAHDEKRARAAAPNVEASTAIFQAPHSTTHVDNPTHGTERLPGTSSNEKILTDGRA